MTSTTATPTPTAPLSSAAASALSCLERALAAPPIVRAVTRYEVASARTAELAAAMDSRDLSGAEFDVLESAQDVMRESLATLAAAGMLHLVAADDHGKTKDPLPGRPRGPHPYRTAGVTR